MLARVQKTPSKLDDVFVLALGFLTFVPFVLRVTGILVLPFPYYEVGIALITLASVLFAWARWLIKRIGETPSTEKTLLGTLALYHLLQIYQIRAVLAGENALPANLWLLVVSYAVSAMLLGRHLWIKDFGAFLAWGVAKVFEGVTSGRSPRDPGVPYPKRAKVNEEAANRLLQEFPNLEDIDLYDKGQPQVVPPPPLEPTFRPPGVNPDYVPSSLALNQLIDLAKDSDAASLEVIIERLARHGDNLGELLAAAGMPEVARSKVLTVVFEQGKTELLSGVMRHPGFAQQRTGFLKALE